MDEIYGVHVPTVFLLVIGVVVLAVLLAAWRKGPGGCQATFAGWALGGVFAGMLAVAWVWCWPHPGSPWNLGFEIVYFTAILGIASAAIGSAVGAWIGLGLSVLWAARAKREAAEREGD